MTGFAVLAGAAIQMAKPTNKTEKHNDCSFIHDRRTIVESETGDHRSLC